MAGMYQWITESTPNPPTPPPPVPTLTAIQAPATVAGPLVNPYAKPLPNNPLVTGMGPQTPPMFLAPAATFASFTPTTGGVAGGTAVTITGTNFQPGSGGSTVTFGGVPATNVVIVSPTSITCVSPPHAAGNALLVLTTSGQRLTNATNFVYA